MTPTAALSKYPTPVPVTFVSERAELGGAERYLETLLVELGDAWVSRVIALRDGPFVARLGELGFSVDVIPIAGLGGLASGVRRLRRALSSNRLGVVHANGAKAALACSLATAGLGVPVLWLKIDLARDGLPAWGIAALCDRAVGISSATLETFPGWLRRQTAVVYAAIPEVGADRPAARRLVLELTGFPPDAEVVVISGRLSPGKGQLELVEAAPHVLEARPRARFAVLGGEDRFFSGYEAMLRGRAEALGASDRFAFLGHRPPGIACADDAARFVAGCDLLVAPSVRQRAGGWREGFGLAAVEALSVGTPVVAYASGALPEVLGGSARLVPEGDRAGLAKAIAGVLASPEERAELARSGQVRVNEHFSIERAAGEMARQYSELASR